jgi:tRNA (guanine37-N1)-methyltransferase
MSWKVSVITLMPEIYPGPLAHALVGDAFAAGKATLDVIALREFGIGVHQKVDDTPYGGGAGMVLKPDVVDAAIRYATAREPEARLVYLTPRGAPLTQSHLRTFITKPLILLAGRYESIDERVIVAHAPEEISLGDFVLMGGDVPALAIIEGCVRLLPEVVGDAASLEEESFGLSQDYACLLEYPHYTKPPIWNGQTVPDILLSGHHANIRAWRKEQAESVTRARRSDLWQRYTNKET